MKQQVKMIALLVGCGLVPPILAEDAGFEQRWYGGFGAGLSSVDPDINIPGSSVSDDSSNGWKLYGGYDWSEKFSIEAYFADLGEAGLSPNGTVGYRDFGLSGLYYFYNNRGEYGRNRRSDLSAFAKAGLGYMDNDSDVAFDRGNDAHIMLGAGLEYGLTNGFSFRAEVELFDDDARFYSVSLLRRFGRSKPAANLPVKQAPATTTAKLIDNTDSDADGVPDRLDKCTKTRAGARVDSVGCQIGEVIILKGVLFETGSARLKDMSRSILDQAVSTLKRYPDMKVEVAGHTDNRGSEAVNRNLSQQRAESVRQFLVSSGISSKRLTAKGYGSSSPIADNSTPEGRTVNRRVELIVQE